MEETKFQYMRLPKGGLLSFVKGVAKEIGVSKKRINIISPSIIKTKTLENLYSSDDIQRMEKTIPLGVCGEIDDLVSAIFWLLSKESNLLPGVNWRLPVADKPKLTINSLS